MSEILFSISNIDQFFGEENKRSILQIPSLEIKKNKFTVIIGNSGSGKTTLLELLGGINEPTAGSICYHETEKEKILFSDLWQNPDFHQFYLQNKAAFVFQQANLISYFDVLENIAISETITKNISLEHAKKNVIQSGLLEHLNMKQIQEQSIATISGGQQQRVALARAVNSNFDIFFADEPTGNVGKKNESVMFQFLRDLVDKNDKSVIMVTHNINKALEFADEIVVIDHRNSFGKIDSKNILSINREKMNLYGEATPNPKPIFVPYDKFNQQKIIDYSVLTSIQNLMYDAKEEQIDFTISHQINPVPKYLLNQAKDTIKRKVKAKTKKITVFQKLLLFFSELIVPLLIKTGNKKSQFIRSYLKKDIAKYYQNKPFSFFIIIFISLFAIALFNSWQVILAKKMNNPFVNILLAKNNSGKSFQSIRTELDQPEFKVYDISHVSPVRSISLKFYSRSSNKYQYISGRSIIEDNPIISHLQQVDTNNSDNEKEGIFITQRMLEKMHYKPQDRYVFLSVGNVKSAIPIAGVYKFLPGDSYLLTNDFYHTIQSGNYYHPKSDRVTLSDMQNRSLASVKSEVKNIITSNSKDLSKLYSKEDKLVALFMNEKEIDFFEELTSKINDHFANLEVLYQTPQRELQIDDEDRINDCSWFFIHRESSKNAEKLKSALLEKNIEIDLEKVSTQKDFYSISRLLHISIFLLIILAFISTLIYIRYSFFLHIYQQRSQLGIIKSLGVPTKAFYSIFRIELFTFLGTIYFLACVSILFIQLVNYMLLQTHLLQEMYIQMIDGWSLLQTALIIISSLISLHFVLKNVIHRTAGDLIYDRNLENL